MALARCPDCRGTVSTTAPACPHCGYVPSAKNASSPTAPRLHLAEGRTTATEAEARKASYQRAVVMLPFLAFAIGLGAYVWVPRSGERQERKRAGEPTSAHEHAAKPSTAPRSRFKCLKISGGPGVSRTCAGPGYLPEGATADELFETAEAWCATIRASYTDSRSIMVCAPTNDECRKELTTASAGNRSIFLRSECAKTTPDAWTAKAVDYPAPDVFLCKKDEDERVELKGERVVTRKITVIRCDATIHELTIGRHETPRDRAWCYAGDSPDAPAQCFAGKDDCEGAANYIKEDESTFISCSERTAKEVVAHDFAFLDH